MIRKPKPLHRMREHTYTGDGLCIMCLDPEQSKLGMTREHIIPDAIGGRLVYRDAVCLVCAREQNQRFENSTLNVDFLTARHLIEVRKKPPSRRLPEVGFHPPGYIFGDTPGVYRSVDPIDYPKFLILPRFNVPGILRGVDEGDGASYIQASIIDLSPYYGPFTIPHDGKVEVVADSEVCALPLSVAKMGYCYAVAERGLESFDGDDIRALLQGKRDDPLNFVGNEPQQKLVNLNALPLHNISLSTTADGFLIARVALFACYGMSAFLVVVGKVHSRK